MKALTHSSASDASTWWGLRSCAPENDDRAAGHGRVAPRANRRLTPAKAAKLLRHADFQRVYKQGRRHFAAHMTVFYLRREEEAGPRVGLTVGRVLGGAVERNRIKRRLREAVRLSLAALAPAAVDVVINPKKSAMAAEFTVLKKEVTRAFELIAKEPRRG